MNKQTRSALSRTDETGLGPSEPLSTDAEKWWIETEGGDRIVGPFESRDLALTVRWYVEQCEHPATFWVRAESEPVAVDGEPQ